MDDRILSTLSAKKEIFGAVIIKLPKLQIFTPLVSYLVLPRGIDLGSKLTWGSKDVVDKRIHPLGSKLPVETKGCNLVTRLTHVGSWFTFMGQSSAANYFHFLFQFQMLFTKLNLVWNWKWNISSRRYTAVRRKDAPAVREGLKPSNVVLL